MKLLRRLSDIVSQKKLASVCCLLAYLVLTAHDLIPHHHEEDIASHTHGHSHSTAHHHHGSHLHKQLKGSHQNQECLLFVHHVNAEDTFISAPAFKKKLLTDYYLASNILMNYSAHDYMLPEYTIQEAHPHLLSHKYTEGPRGPPQA
jgi:hypothetical protein